MCILVQQAGDCVSRPHGDSSPVHYTGGDTQSRFRTYSPLLRKGPLALRASRIKTESWSTLRQPGDDVENFIRI